MLRVSWIDELSAPLLCIFPNPLAGAPWACLLFCGLPVPVFCGVFVLLPLALGLDATFILCPPAIAVELALALLNDAFVLLDIMFAVLGTACVLFDIAFILLDIVVALRPRAPWFQGCKS